MRKSQTTGTCPKRKSVRRSSKKALPGNGARTRSAPKRASRAQVEHFVARAKELPKVRGDLIDRVKAEIEAGAYENPERLDQAIDKLLEELEERS